MTTRWVRCAERRHSRQSGTGSTFTNQPGMGAMFASGDDFIFDSAPRGGSSGSTGAGFFIGNQLFDHDDEISGYSGSSSYLYTRSAVTNVGSLGNVADADFIGWGYWAKGQSSGAVGNGPMSDVHYLVGRPTPADQMPVTGTATYSLAGGTRPTATDAGVTLTGSLLGATLSANFGSGTVDATVSTQFTRANGSVVGVSLSDTASISGSSFQSLGCGNGTVNGFFTGNLAARAGIVYSKSGTLWGWCVVPPGSPRAAVRACQRSIHNGVATLHGR